VAPSDSLFGPPAPDSGDDDSGGPPPGDDDTGDDDSTDDPVETLGATFTLEGDIVAGMPTMATVTWTVDLEDPDAVPDATYLEFGVDDAFDRTRAGRWVAGGDFEADLLGLVPLEDHEIRAVAVLDGATAVSESITLTAGPALSGLPGLSTTGDEDGEDEDGGGYLLTSILSIPSAAVVMDTRGNYLWWYEAELETEFVPRAHLSRSGDAVLVMTWDSAPDAPQGYAPRILEVGFDGEVRREVPVQGAHHDFVELPDGTLAVLVQDRRTEGAIELIGDSILEIAPDGTETVIWSTWDDLEPVYSPDLPEPTLDWTHANAIDYDEARDVYHVSLYSMGSIVEVDRSQGSLTWMLGGPLSDFSCPTMAMFFNGQHQFQVMGDRILVFENGTQPTDNSRAVELQLDSAGGTAAEIWSYTSSPALMSYTLGDVSRMDAGDTLVTWATCGRIDRVTAAGEVAWSVSGQIGGGFGYTTWFEEWPEGGDE